ncbi:HNH endonuclease [Demequina mangrovi]|uniref:5-methylcytosine-specific restriction enzyme A n=1 Tax=Demequina mangrovi TaxID=1043493 RepID=A0A1H6V064_9MICO|nr:HNH endonuclease signature motif containing protein [Demequina mangrovi]SEI97983.1 5-methylcytosine-specific restriction enzyme A [Demequina mangrovi]
MTFSAARLVAAIAALRGFEGRDLGALSAEELALFEEASAAVYRHAGVAVAAGAAESMRRSCGAHGSPKPSDVKGRRRETAQRLGIDERGAQQFIDAGGDPEASRHKVVRRAFRGGRIGAAAVEVLERTLDTIGDVPEGLEARLVAKAERLTLRELRRACEQAIALHDRASLEEKERRHRDQRELLVGRDHDGMVTLRARLDAASAAPVLALLDAQVRDVLQRRRDDRVAAAGDARTAGQIRADALVALAQHCLGCAEPGSGVRSEVVVRLDHEALETGLGVGTCDSLGGPISASTLRLMAVDAAVIPSVLGGDGLPLDWGRSRRLFAAPQRKAIAERDGGCAWCLAPPTWCVVHHVRFWSDGGGTDLDNGVLLCTGCHVRLHSTEWELELRNGLPWLIPPAAVDPDRTPIRGGVARLDPHAIP